jgi:archaellum component FlaF (FlaF/FlaG flagellin family)
LTIRLSLRKRVKKLTANSKGFSSVIGTTFMVLVMMFLSTSVFLWTLSQNTLYNEAVKARNQEEADRINENVVAVSGNYSVSGDQVTVNVVLKNAGSVAVQIINLWVLDSDPSNRRYTNKSLNLNLKSGDVLNLVGSSGLKVTIPGADPSHNFASWFVTAKGNTIPLEKEQGVIVAQLAQGIGSLALDFSTFRFFTYATSTRLANYSDGNKNITVPGQGTPIAFGAILTNLDPQKVAITLNQYSNIWLIFPGAPGQIIQFFIVSVASNGTITTPYSPITIAFGETKLIVFASSSSSSFSQSSIPPPLTPNPAAVNLLLLGTIGTRGYGQNIPFVSLYVYKP